MKVLQKYPPFSVLALAILPLPTWAAAIDVPGVPNFHQVDEHVYRGAQPSEHGWQSLAKLGVKTVIDLRREDEHSSRLEARAVESAGMQYINVPMAGVIAPSDEQIKKLLGLLQDSGAGPVFVHCKRGADRTGAVIACYRIAHDHWQNKRALSEAKSYGMSWTQVGLRRYVMKFRPAADGRQQSPQAGTLP